MKKNHRCFYSRPSSYAVTNSGRPSPNQHPAPTNCNPSPRSIQLLFDILRMLAIHPAPTQISSSYPISTLALHPARYQTRACYLSGSCLPSSSCLLSSACPLSTFFSLDCACGRDAGGGGGGGGGGGRLVGEGKLAREGRASSSRRQSRCRLGGFWVLATKASCHQGVCHQGVCHQRSVPPSRVRDLAIKSGGGSRSRSKAHQPRYRYRF